MSTLVKRSFSLAGHRTSVALEPAFWDALEQAAQMSDATLLAIVASVDAERAPEQSLASALRVWALHVRALQVRALQVRALQVRAQQVRGVEEKPGAGR